MVKFAILTIVVFSMTSCLSDEGEFKLTGNIEQYIPKESYSLEHSVNKKDDGISYITFTPKLNEKFAYWGLNLRQVEYYEDGELLKTVDGSLGELSCKISDIGIGRHEILAKMTIQGEECDDVVLEDSYDFSISSQGYVSQVRGDFYIDYNYVTTGETLQITPYLLAERSSKDCKIEKVVYYWDGDSIDTKNSSPFSLNFQVNDAEGSEHKLHIVIHYNDINGTGMYNWSYGNYKIQKETETVERWAIKSNREDYKIGETVQIVANRYKWQKQKETCTFNVYMDGNKIGSSSVFPYELNYEIKDISIGTHTIKGEFVKQYSNTHYSISENKEILVTP